MVGVEGCDLAGGRGVADDEGAVGHSPEAFALLQVRELRALYCGEAEFTRGVRGFADLLLVDDLGGAVSEEASSKVAGF